MICMVENDEIYNNPSMFHSKVESQEDFWKFIFSQTITQIEFFIQLFNIVLLDK